MNILGIKWLALLSAAIGIYATGFIIYGLLIPSETWMLWSNISQEDMDRVGTSRMMYSALMPVMIAIGVGLVVKWRQIDSLAQGASTGLLMAFLFLVGGRLYNYVYGVEGLDILLLDSAHLLMNGLIAGAILGAWKGKSYVE